jgi:MFS family permease
VFLALGAQLARDLIGSTNIFVTGLVLAILSATGGLTAILTRRFAATRQVLAGTGFVTSALVLLEVSARTHSLPLFILTSLLAGVSYGLLFAGGLGLVATHAPARHRGGTVSAVYLVAYVGQGVVALSLGLIATASGLGTALLLGVIAIGVLAVLAFAVGATLAVRGNLEAEVR